MRLLLASAVAACSSAQHAAAPPCPTDRKLVLAAQDDVRRAAACETAVGVTIRTGGDVDVSPLRKLTAIDGDLVVGPSVAVREVTLSELVSVGGTIHIVANGSLTGVFLPRLEHAGRIDIDGNVALTTLSLPRLATVDGAVLVTDNAVLELVAAGSLTTVGKDLVISGAPSLTLLELGKLVKSDGIRLERTPQLPQDIVEQLGKPSSP
jgi:hypothetical protein